MSFGTLRGMSPKGSCPPSFWGEGELSLVPARLMGVLLTMMQDSL